MWRRLDGVHASILVSWRALHEHTFVSRITGAPGWLPNMAKLSADAIASAPLTPQQGPLKA
ncbi:hypothetical protein ART_0104 [Arthrobacter sp. PAMC 25486]|nr:hypothetical protein ART_0104 [Arthrobacter sp. PAMC 25486]